ncbi:MAG: redox-sensing transcriptional repressor Rex [Spirochaetales bacterium]|nr:redox-sensing transcriptional repressor Rex [Spirochaetales bacterium]
MIIPQPALERLCRMRILLEELKEKQITVDSQELAGLCGSSPDTVRKDIGYLKNFRGGKQGYVCSELSDCIKTTFNLAKRRKACVVGLGKLGSAILEYPGFFPAGYELAAGFDSDINLVELKKSGVPLFASYEISEKVRQLGIELGILAVPFEAAQKSFDRLAEGGIKGVLNFSSAILKMAGNIYVRNISFLHEFDIISALSAGIEI